MLIVCMFYLSVCLSVRLYLSVWTNPSRLIIRKHIKVVSIDGLLALLAAFLPQTNLILF